MISDRGILCIDWDERSLRAVDARLSRSGVRVRAAAHVPIDPSVDVRDPDMLGAFIRRALAEHRIRTRTVIVDIPRQDAVLNLLSLPIGTRDELAAMVHIQIAKELPFPKEQAVIDFAVSPSAESGGTVDVWVSAVRTHVIEHYEAVIKAAGLKLERIGLRPYAFLAALSASQPEGRTLAVDIGPSIAEINVVHDGRLVYSRAASVSMMGHFAAADGSRADAEDDLGLPTTRPAPTAAHPIDALLIEVNRTITAYRATDPGAQFDRIVLSGSVGIDEEIRRAFESRFNVRAWIYEAPPSVEWRRRDDVSPAPFAATMGLAISTRTSETEHFDFLHPKEPEAGRRERARRRPVMAATILLFVATAGVLLYRPIRERKAELARIERQIDLENKDADERKDFMKRYVDVSDWRDNNANAVWLDLIQHLAEVFPGNENCYITELRCDPNGEITIELAATDRKVATDFIGKLREIKGDVMQDGEKRQVRLFDAEPRTPKPRDDEKYPYTDMVVVQVRALQSDK
jgi:type IV pilus assembly protein PilM